MSDERQESERLREAMRTYGCETVQELAARAMDALRESADLRKERDEVIINAAQCAAEIAKSRQEAREHQSQIADLRDQLGERDAELRRLQRSLAQMQAMYDERGSRILEIIAENDALRGDPAPSIPEPAPVAGGEPVTPRVLAWLATQAVNVGEDAVSSAVALVLARDAYGRAKYGQGLCMGDGRDTVEDLRQELGDALQYGIKARAEGVEGERLEELRDLAHLVWLLMCADNVEGGR